MSKSSFQPFRSRHWISEFVKQGNEQEALFCRINVRLFRASVQMGLDLPLISTAPSSKHLITNILTVLQGFCVTDASTHKGICLEDSVVEMIGILFE